MTGNKRMALVIVWMLLSMAGVKVCAQSALVKASVDKQKILLGEPLLLTLEIRTPGNSNTQLFKVDSIPHFEFLKRDSIVKEQVGGATVTKQYFRLISFDSGRWVIPPIILRPNIRTAAILVDVVFSEPFDPAQSYHDIQDIKEVPFKLSKSFEKWWYIVTALLLMITLIIYWLTAPKKIGHHTRKIREGAYGKAKRLLKELKNSTVSENKFYTSLVEIFRDYLVERTGINSLQQISGDLIEKIKPLFQNNDAGYKNLSQVLLLCDYVKFAKYNPEDAEAQSAYEIINGAIESIENTVKLAADKTAPVFNLPDKEEVV